MSAAKDDPLRLSVPVDVGLHRLKPLNEFAVGHTDDGHVCMFIERGRGFELDASSARALATALIEVADGIESGSPRGALTCQ